MVGDYTVASIMHSTIISFFILCSLYKESLSVRFKVLSAASVSVTFGSDVVLPCRLTPEMNAEKMEIRWFKPMYQPYVHLCINGKDDYSIQMPQFTNRTELIKENITRGVFPLMIHNVTAQDSGEYYCFVESSEHHGKATVQLHVTAVGTLPNISSIRSEDNHTVYCESRDWHPQPYLLWTDNKGNKIIPSMQNVFRDENNLYRIISAINQPTTSYITCTVSNSLNQTKQNSRQIREKGLRNTSTRFIITWPSVAVSLISFWCICLQAMNPGLYVGETGQTLPQRMNSHRFNIKPGNTDAPVAAHFCSNTHSIKDLRGNSFKG
ncbi:butyrophilin-like protein 10 [Xenopus laevis]|uniref:Butyrophilin-like protein 10 n=2 Tax=Xenopus laevis TaxID=8355 RepID=A0A1L8FCI2_XENLA|nr:butyrophilin-like protein 10 [Xenopus laevis]XP_041429531.1 butyrophilin-like protein 10 [Xenopus laevis]XP_041429532.1 butyrophilin-like protein 10 [Xenopus laevis]OCT69294.1 hypothetical protein XELAEV_18040607mg [Xenopus laevis]